MAERRDELLPGTLDVMVLKVLSSGSLHGYAVANRIQVLSEDVLRVEEGSLYPALHRMERRGWISSSWGRSESNRRAKFYRLTRTGRRRLGEQVAAWERLATGVGRVLAAPFRVRPA